MVYPQWAYFPRQTPAPEWVTSLMAAVESKSDAIDSRDHLKLDSDRVVAHLREPLEALGWQVETGKKQGDKIHRPVLFGDNGSVRVKQELDGWHPDLRAVLEVESGRAILGNAIFRDLVRASLVADAEFLVIGVRLLYRYKSGANTVSGNDFERTRDTLDSIYASGRLGLPFTGVLVFGW